MNLTIYNDIETSLLKESLKFIEIEISLTASEIAEIERQIHQYEIRYNAELGDLIEKLLEKRKEILRKESEENKHKIKDFQEAQRDYDDFKTSYEELKNIKQIELSQDEQIEIRTKFKMACKLCHPDKVADEYKSEAQAIFIQLKEAYDKNDLVKVSEILTMLEKGIFKIGSDLITEKEKLLLLFNSLTLRLEKLKNELNELKHSEVYRVIASINDFDSHFYTLKQQLTEDLNNR